MTTRRKSLVDYCINGKNYRVTLREARMLDRAFIDGKDIGYRECVEATSRLLNEKLGKFIASIIPTRRG